MITIPSTDDVKFHIWFVFVDVGVQCGVYRG